MMILLMLFLRPSEASSDYIVASTVFILNGTDIVTSSVVINDDDVSEGTEKFTAHLVFTSGPSPSINLAPNITVGSILDNDRK